VGKNGNNCGEANSNSCNCKTGNTLKSCFFSIPPEQFSLLSSLLGILLIDNLDLDQGDFGSFMVKIFDLWFALDNPNISIRYLEQILIGLLGGKQNLCKFSGSCDKYVTINYNGLVTSCDNFLCYNDLMFGDIKTESIKKILNGDRRKKVNDKIKAHSKICENCEFFGICAGGCRRYGFQINEQYSPNYFCKDRKLLFLHIMSMLSDNKTVLRNIR